MTWCCWLVTIPTMLWLAMWLWSYMMIDEGWCRINDGLCDMTVRDDNRWWYVCIMDIYLIRCVLLVCHRVSMTKTFAAYWACDSVWCW
jgi:hypothetical protein